MKFSIIIFILVGLISSVDNISKDEDVEKLSRRIYSFNRGVDKIFLDPVTTVYVKVTPSFVKTGFNNFFRNIVDCQNTVSSLFYKDWYNCINSLMRFTINSTVGIFGTFDVADYIVGLKYEEIDNNILGLFYDGKVRYIVAPVIGPGAFIDHMNLLTIQLLNPYVYLINTIPLFYFIEIINKKSILMFDNNFFHKTMEDGYLFLKDAHAQRSIFLLNPEDDSFLDEPGD